MPADEAIYLNAASTGPLPERTIAALDERSSRAARRRRTACRRSSSSAMLDRVAASSLLD